MDAFWNQASLVVEVQQILMVAAEVQLLEQLVMRVLMEEPGKFVELEVVRVPMEELEKLLEVVQVLEDLMEEPLEVEVLEVTSLMEALVLILAQK